MIPLNRFQQRHRLVDGDGSALHFHSVCSHLGRLNQQIGDESSQMIDKMNQIHRPRSKRKGNADRLTDPPFPTSRRREAKECQSTFHACCPISSEQAQRVAPEQQRTLGHGQCLAAGDVGPPIAPYINHRTLWRAPNIGLLVALREYGRDRTAIRGPRPGSVERR